MPNCLNCFIFLCLVCHGQFNWINPKTVSRNSNYRERKIRESLKIKKAKCDKKKKILNRDRGNLVKTNAWTRFLSKLVKMTSDTSNEDSTM